MKPTPSGWPRLSSSVFYHDPREAIDWLCRAFGFELRLKVEGNDGVIHHSELCFADTSIIVRGSGGKAAWRARYHVPQATGWIAQPSALFVDDVDAHQQRAFAAGAKIIGSLGSNESREEHRAERAYGALDLEGHSWLFMQRTRSPSGCAKPN